MQWLLGLLLLIASDAWAARQFNPNEVIVMQDSKFVRAVYARPVTSDLFDLLVARETFRLADDQKAVKALDEYLARVGLLALAGEAVAPSGTVERIITDPSALPSVPSDLASRILSTALTPRLAVSVNAEKHLPDPKSSFQTNKQEYPGVWSSWHQERASLVQVLVLVENTGRNRITQFDARLQIDWESAEKPIELNCRASPWFDDVAPGASRLHVCFAEGERVAIPALVQAVRAAEKTPSRWRLVPTRINFADPAVNFGSRGVYYWLDTGRAAQQAAIAVKAAGCDARGSCSEDFQMKIKSDRRYVLIPGGALAGIVLGCLIAWVARRPMIAGTVVSLLMVAGGVAGVVKFFMTATTGWEVFGAMIVAVLAFSALAPFLVALWVTIAIVRSLRGGPAPAPQPQERMS